MRTSLALNNRTEVKNQGMLKNVILSFLFTLVILFVFLIINTFGVSQKNYASNRSENPYRIKSQLESVEYKAGLELTKK
jgi:hypothetical protein